MTSDLQQPEPTRTQIDAMPQPLVLEFGALYCGYCQSTQTLIASAFSGRTGFRHIKVEDGKGRRLGRMFTVKLWPTLIFLRQGKEVARLVRPASTPEIVDALNTLLDTPQSL